MWKDTYVPPNFLF